MKITTDHPGSSFDFPMPDATTIPTLPYTHVGRRLSTGHYAVTADAERTQGKIHALVLDHVRPGTGRLRGKLDIRDGDRPGYVGLCGVVVTEASDDEFCAAPQVREATAKDRITCKRCRGKLGL